MCIYFVRLFWPEHTPENTGKFQIFQRNGLVCLFVSQFGFKMPRGRSRGRSSSPGPSFRRPTMPATRPASNVASTTQPSQVQRQGPGLFGQMASTAAGVAVGSTIGHVVGGALTSGYHGDQEAVSSSQHQGVQGQTSQNPCQFEFEQFVQCAQNQHDITFCKGFNEVLKQCKMEHGLM